jgi:tRNA (cmo5U34)-methyltransferase
MVFYSHNPERKTMNFDADFGRQYEKVSIRSIPGYELLFQLANDFLKATLPESADLLIVGAGGGKEIVTFGGANLGWRFVGVDPAAQMIAFARYKAEQSGLQERVQLIQGVAKDAPTDPLFDAATCLLVFPFVHGDDAKLSTLREISARLKPGAPLIIATVVGDGWNDDFFNIWRAFQADSGSLPGEVAGVEATVRASVQPVPETHLLELMSEAGFRDAVPFYRAIWFAGWFAWKKKD